MVKLADIARELGINVSVISRALSPSPDKNAVVKKETAELIRDTARRMGYRPNRQASFLGKGQCATIFCFLPDIPTRLINDLMFGIAETACQENFPINFFLGRNAADFGKFLLHSEKNAHSGLLTLPPGKMPANILRDFCEYHRRGGKVLFLNTFSNTPVGTNNDAFADIPYLNIDEYYGGKLAAGHLLRCGCDEFFMVSAGQENIFAMREAGFADRLAQAGVSIRKIDSGNLATLPLRGGRSGFFADSDYLALDMYPVFAARGLKIGRDVLLCGFDDIFYSRISLPSLSTVHQPTRLEGGMAVRKLVGMIYGDAGKNETVTPYLMVRESTGGERPDPEFPEREQVIRTME